MPISPIFFIGLICLTSGGSLFPVTEAIWLTVPTSGVKCVYEKIEANVVVVADYLCIDEGFTQLGPTLDIQVCILTILHLLRKFPCLYKSGNFNLTLIAYKGFLIRGLINDYIMLN